MKININLLSIEYNEDSYYGTYYSIIDNNYREKLYLNIINLTSNNILPISKIYDMQSMSIINGNGTNASIIYFINNNYNYNNYYNLHLIMN